MGDDPEYEEWQREREMRRAVSMEGPGTGKLTESLDKSEPSEPDSREAYEATKQPNKIWNYVLKAVIVFALLRRVFMDAIASAESPSAYGAPTTANYVDIAIIIIILVLFFTKKAKLAGILLGIYAALLLIGSLIGLGIDANGKVWMMITALIILGALILMKYLEGNSEPQEISNADIERLKENPVRRF